MVAGPIRPTRLAEQDVALARLLDDLLGGLPAAETPPLSSPVTGPVPSVGLNQSVEPPLQDASVPDPTTGGRPAWAGVRFRALLFRVGGHRFAMPLVALHSVAAMDRRPTALPQQPAWQIGVVRYRDQAVRVADLMALLGLTASGQPPRYLLVLGSGRAAVACDAIDDAIEVTRDAVRWRHAGRSRPWLVGFLVDSLSAVLDPLDIEKQIGMVNA
jgi:purine-binding chemotaxis protein CheW